MSDEHCDPSGLPQPSSRLFSRIGLSAREDIRELHRCGPDVYAQMVANGEPKNFWLTGAAAWNCYAIGQSVLYGCPTHNVRRLHSRFRRRGRGFTAKRQLNGVTYFIAY